MAWNDFQNESYSLTRKEIARVTRDVMRNYDEAYRNIEKRLKDLYSVDLSTVAPDDYYNEIIKRDRLKNILSELREKYLYYSRRAAYGIKAASSIGISNEYYRKMYAAQWMRPEITVGILPRELVELAVLGTEENWKRITQGIMDKYGSMKTYMPQAGTLSELLKLDRQREIKKIQDAITQGLIRGDSYTKTSRAVKNVVGKYTPGKTTGAKANALRIIRTESNRTMNAGSYASTKQLQTQGIDVRRRLVAVLDDRTRPQSAQMDGQERGPDEPFTYPNGTEAMIPGESGVAKYDINDRETVIDIIGGEGPQIRRGRNPQTGENEVFTYRDFDEWANDQGLTRNKYGELLPEK